jgi:outer membrane protein OmpA-like peptidoglycan-associated protein
MFGRLPISILASLLMVSSLVTAQDVQIYESDFNSSNSDFSPVMYGDDIVFCSNRARKIDATDIDSTDQYYTDLYIKKLDDNKKPEIFSKYITGRLNEGPCTFSPNRDTIYYKGNIIPKSQQKKKNIKVYKLGILGARWNGEHWEKMPAFEHNSDDYNVAHPALTPDGQTMIFVSNMEGSIGGADLYISHRTYEGWSVPIQDFAEVTEIRQELDSAAHEPGVLKQMILEQFHLETVKQGDYILPSDDEHLNREMQDLENIQFELDSDVILVESHDHLEYIANMLGEEENFHLHIKAHTCDLGGRAYNEELSQRRASSVVQFLSDSGIAKTQMSWAGIGQAEPLVPNEDDISRAANRRVEFTVSFKPVEQ